MLKIVTPKQELSWYETQLEDLQSAINELGRYSLTLPANQI